MVNKGVLGFLKIAEIGVARCGVTRFTTLTTVGNIDSKVVKFMIHMEIGSMKFYAT